MEAKQQIFAGLRLHALQNAQGHLPVHLQERLSVHRQSRQAKSYYQFCNVRFKERWSDICLSTVWKINARSISKRNVLQRAVDERLF